MSIGLGHFDQFNHIISRLNSMFNPVLFAISYELWTPYHNFRAFRWYNQYKYDWSHRRILTRDGGTWTRYEHYKNAYQYIPQLTPLDNTESRIIRIIPRKSSEMKTSSITYFKQNVSNSDHKKLH